VTSFLADYGVFAIFVLMAIDAVFPAASELVMLYGGALASGALTHELHVFGWHTTGFGAYLAVVLAGILGFQRWEGWAVLVGRLTPVARSFISIPAGIFEVEFRRYNVLTLIGNGIWCAVLAGIGWAIGANYKTFDHDFRYVEIAVVAGIVVLVAYLVMRRRRAATI